MLRAEPQDLQLQVYRRMKPWQRLQIAAELYWFAREIIKNREKKKNSNLNQAMLDKRVRSFF